MVGQQPKAPTMPAMDNELIKQFEQMGMFKIAIAILIIVAAFILILIIFKRRSIRKGKALTGSIDNINTMKSHDRWILQANKFIKAAGSIIKATPFKLDPITRDYLNYNIKRANKRVPGGFRYITADEWTASNLCILLAVVALELGLYFINPALMVIGIAVTIAIGSTMPRMLLRNTVAIKDKQLNSQFPDFYLMLHYILMSGGTTPIDRIMRSYARTTEKEEIKRFIDIACDYIDTYSEYGAMQHIIDDYKEVNNICRLCRLIKQMYSGGRIESELKGFREELLIAKRLEIEAKTDKLIAKAQRSFMLLMIILVQAVVSATLIYMPDIFSGLGSFM